MVCFSARQRCDQPFGQTQLQGTLHGAQKLAYGHDNGNPDANEPRKAHVWTRLMLDRRDPYPCKQGVCAVGSQGSLLYLRGRFHETHSQRKGTRHIPKQASPTSCSDSDSGRGLTSSQPCSSCPREGF